MIKIICIYICQTTFDMKQPVNKVIGRYEMKKTYLSCQERDLLMSRMKKKIIFILIGIEFNWLVENVVSIFPYE